MLLLYYYYINTIVLTIIIIIIITTISDMVREFRHVVFEDVVFDNNSYVTPY